MSDLERPTPAAVGKMKREELKDLVLKLLEETSTDIVANQHGEIMPMLQTILDEVKKGNQEREKLKTELEELKTKNEIITRTLSQQQRFLEMLDGERRANRLIVHGIPEKNMTIDGNELANDDEKVSTVLQKINHDSNEIIKVRRLGQPAENDTQKIRPIEVSFTSCKPRDKILQDARHLKDKGIPFANIRIKKDLHPAVRQEWKRLKELEEEEKARPENTGMNIRIDYRKRVLLRDDVVIAKWQPKFFQ